MPIELVTLEEQQKEFRSKLFEEFQKSEEYNPLLSDTYYQAWVFASNKLFSLPWVIVGNQYVSIRILYLMQIAKSDNMCLIINDYTLRFSVVLQTVLI